MPIVQTISPKRGTVNYTDIIESLRPFTSHQQIDLISAETSAQSISKYPPLHKDVLDLKNIVKPETAAEDLFTALCKDVLGIQPTRQVSSGNGRRRPHQRKINLHLHPPRKSLQKRANLHAFASLCTL